MTKLNELGRLANKLKCGFAHYSLLDQIYALHFSVFNTMKYSINFFSILLLLLVNYSVGTEITLHFIKISRFPFRQHDR